ncbi:MAG: hypothetical protein ACTSO2_04820 [Promethearchaeota archaeon]
MKNLIIVAFCFVPIGYFSYYVSFINFIYSDLVRFSLENEPEPSMFMKEINFTRLAEMVNETDYRFELYHMPNNLSSACYFEDNDTFSNVTYYYYSDNEALWTGTALSGWVHKYLALKRENADSQMINDTLRVIKKLTHGLSMLMAVPNGGLGPQYSGILARGYAYPKTTKENELTGYFYYQENPRHFNGTGKYSMYRWRGYTSNDEHAGYYMAMALLLKYIAPIDEYVNETVHLIIDQLCNFMLKTNFQGIHATGGPTGVEQKADLFSGGFWTALLLKMGAICYPEKYERIYYHFIIDQLDFLANKESGPHESVSNYYAYNFGIDVCYAFLTLEGKETEIGRRFYEGFLDSLWAAVKNHRNAYFNSIFLALCDNPDDYPIIQWDIQDQLMRFEINHFPDRMNGFLTPNESYYQIDQNFEKWKNYFQYNINGRILRHFFPEVHFESSYYTRPLTVEYRPPQTFMWESNPYQVPYSFYNITLINVEYEGLSLTVPYWIARAFNVIELNGVKIWDINGL